MREEKYKNILSKLIISALLLSLILSLPEIKSLLRNEFVTVNTARGLSLPGLKIAKDLFIFLILITATYIQFLRKKNFFLLLLIPLYFAIPIYFFAAMQTNVLYSLSGLRWVLPFFLPFFLIGLVDRQDLRNITKVVLVLFLFSCFFQVVELYNNNMYGPGILKYIVRTPGIFLVPNTLAGFNCVLFCLVRFYLKDSALKWVLLCFFIPISTLLSASGTGLICMLMIMFMTIIPYLTKKQLTVSFRLCKVFSLFAIGSIFTFLPYLTGRPDIIDISGSKRVKIFENLWNSTEFFSPYFGKFTNTFYSLDQFSTTYLSPEIIDSTWGTILGNFGIFGLLLSVFVGMLWLAYLMITDNPEFFAFSVVAFCFSLTSSVSESFPFFLILSVYFAYFISNTGINQVFEQMLTQHFQKRTLQSSNG